MLRSIVTRLERQQVAAFVVWTYRLLAIALALYFVVYAWRTRRDVELLKTQLESDRRTNAANAQSVQDQLDTFYRTLYTDPELREGTKLEARVAELIKKLPQRQPSVVELWQRNRDKELRDRLLRMERWRMDVERRINELR